MFKIWERRAQCLLKLGRLKEVTIAFDEAVTSVNLAKLDKKKKDKFMKDIKNGLESIKNEENKLFDFNEKVSSSEERRDAILNIGKIQFLRTRMMIKTGIFQRDHIPSFHQPVP